MGQNITKQGITGSNQKKRSQQGQTGPNMGHTNPKRDKLDQIGTNGVKQH